MYTYSETIYYMFIRLQNTNPVDKDL